MPSETVKSFLQGFEKYFFRWANIVTTETIVRGKSGKLQHKKRNIEVWKNYGNQLKNGQILSILWNWKLLMTKLVIIKFR